MRIKFANPHDHLLRFPPFRRWERGWVISGPSVLGRKRITTLRTGRPCRFFKRTLYGNIR
ncbi:MAG TPA: hypothetical protein VKI65_06855 [Gemmataceae bacterium]|nr:hypothetical protein [Gemmataceae bacterium]